MKTFVKRSINSSQKFVLSALFLTSFNSIAQTFSGSGTDWNSASNWSTGSVPTGSSTDVSVGSSKSPTVITGANNIIGSVSLTSSETFTVQSGATLTVGSSALLSASTKKSMTFTSSGTINVNTGGSGDGLLEIWGDLSVTSGVQMNISGNLIVHGDFKMTSSGQVTITGGGTVAVAGDFSGTSSGQITVSGSGSKLTVAGALSLGSSGQITTSSGGRIVAGSCSCQGCSSQCGALPIKLLSFEAHPMTDKVVLEWTTLSEFNFDYFSLERSDEGSVFTEIAQVKGNGTTNERHNYSFEDLNPIIGRSYYRLTSIDLDGYTETFPVISIEYEGAKKFSVSPNPTDGSFMKLNFNFAKDPDSQVTIYDNLGSVINSYKISDNDLITFESPLKMGVYLVKYASSSTTQTERLLVK